MCNYYGKTKMVSSGLARLLKTHFFERKANFPVKKSFWPNPPPIIECDKPQGTVYNSSEASVTITFGNLRSFLQDLRGCWKHSFLKGKFSSEKSFWPVFHRVFEFEKPQGTISISPKASLTVTDEKLRSFLQELKGCWKHIFLKKKANFPVRKRFCRIFSVYIEHNKCQHTFFFGQQGLFDN